MNNIKKFEWAIVGSGIAGIITSEILTREGHEVVLIEKNDKLASETTRNFHEWMHAGSLFTLIPDKLRTLKFILGAIDDLFEYYGSFNRMNLKPTEKGLDVRECNYGWFNKKNHIFFKFRIKGRKSTFPWLIGVARAIFLINKIKEHDWLRRRAGVFDPFKYRIKDIWEIIKELVKHKDKFYVVKTPDFTMNSRNILNDIISKAVDNGLEISTSNKILEYEKTEEGFLIKGERESFIVEKIALCNGGNITDFVKNTTVKKSYAPMAVIDNINENSKSFVELDYYPKNCINIITKENNIGLVGGISFNNEAKCEEYINEVIEKHKIYQPQIRVLKKYNGVKSEVILKGEPRNYLFHIKEVEKDIWMVIPGKFTLGFSIGPEFYRRVYHKNPKKYFNMENNYKKNKFISNTVWKDVYINKINRRK